MRKNKSVVIAVILAVTASFFTVSCTKPKGEDGDSYGDFNKKESTNTVENYRNLASASNNNTIEIRERMFATQVSDVYLNADDYLGKTIKLEGIFKKEQWDETGQTYCYVVRYGPGGCCGLDANVGFEVAWANDRARAYPDSESWVEATGVLKILEELEEDEDSQYLYLDLSSLNVLSKRGAETVRQ